MAGIRKAAVIGAGTMGSGIASHLANAGVPVVLLDVIPEGAGDANALAKAAVERMHVSSPPAFMHPDNRRLITPGNIDDDLSSIADADWIAEAVVERLDVKRALYEAVDAVRALGSIVTSNTSTIPLALLTEGMPESLKRDFCITHFFNPVRYMRLLEIVKGPATRPEVIEALTEFCDLRLGKGVVPCRDTPGFLANRIGVFALQVGIMEAAGAGLTVEEADAIMGRPMGIPKTGVFGLYDLIGLDLMLDVVASLGSALGSDDPFKAVAGGFRRSPSWWRADTRATRLAPASTVKCGKMVSCGARPWIWAAAGTGRRPGRAWRPPMPARQKGCARWSSIPTNTGVSPGGCWRAPWLTRLRCCPRWELTSRPWTKP